MPGLLSGICMLIAAVTLGCGGERAGTTVPAEDTAAHADEHDHNGGHGHDEEGEHGEEIAMTPAMIKDAGITVESATLRRVGSTITAPGRVIPTQGGVAHVGTVVPGRISRLLVSEGSYVNSGAALAEIEAYDIGQLKGEYLTAQASVEQARSVLARQQKLSGEGIGAKRTLEEAQADQAQATASLRAAEAKLRAAGIDPATIKSGGAFSSRITLRSPISGVIARRLVALGEYLEPNRDAFEVVNTSTVWVDAQINPVDASTLAVGGVAHIRDRDDHKHTGRITFISPTLDPETRTVTVRTEISNPNVHLRPETFVNVELERSVEGGSALALPAGAIEREGTNYYIYREHEPNTFQRVQVGTDEGTGEMVVITSGLKEGDRVAVSGIFYLKAARQKGELQEHHH